LAACGTWPLATLGRLRHLAACGTWALSHLRHLAIRGAWLKTLGHRHRATNSSGAILVGHIHAQWLKTRTPEITKIHQQ